MPAPTPAPTPPAPTPAPTPTNKAYAIVLDCGSTSTKLFLFEQKVGSSDIAQVLKETREVPLSSFADEPGKAAEELRDFVTNTVKKYPAKFAEVPKAETRLFAYATAGLRYVAASEADKIWEKVGATLNETGFSFTEDQAMTISGDLEGVYQFIGVNKLLEQYDVKTAADDDWYGILEMGGASLQLTFKPDTSILLHEFQIGMAGGDKVPVYSNSWLGFGSQQAFYRSCEWLLARGIDEHPCLLRSDKPYDITMYEDTPNEKNATFEGAGDRCSCYGLVSQLLHQDYECLQQPCSIMGSYAPRPSPSRKFLGIASMYYTVQMLGLTDNTGPNNITVSSILAKTDDLCSLTAEQWETSEFKLNVSRASWEFSQYACFQGYLVAQLLRAFKIDELEFALKIEGNEPTWTRGVALLELQEPTGGATAARTMKVQSTQEVRSTEGEQRGLIPRTVNRIT